MINFMVAMVPWREQAMKCECGNRKNENKALCGLCAKIEKAKRKGNFVRVGKLRGVEYHPIPKMREAV